MPNPHRLLVISETAQHAAYLEPLLSKARYVIAASLDKQANYIEAMQQHEVDVIMAYLCAPSLSVINQFYELNTATPKPIVLLTQESEPSLTQDIIHAGVSVYVADAFHEQRLKHLIDLAVVRFNEVQALKNEVKAIKSQLNERKTIERAKGLIMQNRNLNEDQAYKAMRKLAMDQNQRLIDIANDIINISKVL